MGKTVGQGRLRCMRNLGHGAILGHAYLMGGGVKSWE